MINYQQQFDKLKNQIGFIAALDQSGGSTPKALANYGIDSSAFSNDEEMFDIVHAMRSRIITSPVFTGERILGAILFENTMDREVEGQLTADYLWDVKQVVPFLKVDQGLADQDRGVQLMKPMPRLDALLDKAKQRNIFGTKMRSVIKEADSDGIDALVEQQFDVGRQILGVGFIPIIEPEVDILSEQKADIEDMLLTTILAHLDKLDDDQSVMLKLTLPEQDGHYSACIEHPRILRVVALSGGYSREEANRRLYAQTGMVASFSRALSEGLNNTQSDDKFSQTLNASIESIFLASST